MGDETKKQKLNGLEVELRYRLAEVRRNESLAALIKIRIEDLENDI